MLGPTGGYIMGFVLAAAVVGYLAERGWDRSVWRTALAMLAGGLWLLLLQMGVSVGLFVGLWVFTLPALLVPLLVSHYRDSYQRRGGNR